MVPQPQLSSINKVNRDSLGRKVVMSLVGGLYTYKAGWSGWNQALYNAYTTAQIVMKYPTLTNAVREVKNFDSDKQAWRDINSNLYDKNQNWTAKQYISDIQQQYSDLIKRLQSFKEQSRIAAGRRPTILTSGRGVSGTPALALRRMKSKLGE